MKLGQGGIDRVSGYTGHDITFKCKYEDADRNKRKYLCKNIAAGCEDIIRTDQKNRWEHKNRFSLYYNTSEGFLTVVISKLNSEDAGIYWCAVDEPLSAGTPDVTIDKFETVQLSVRNGECTFHRISQ